ncbi:MAG: RHS repeat protein [Armatimonadetes bacterium]|nr:RHS repeat protein [Armatimonadota bacterium]
MHWYSTPTTYPYDDNGNLVKIDGRIDGGADFGVVTMAYDKENRLAGIVDHNGQRTTYTYSGDGLKRSEVTGSGQTTIVWDGSEYLQGRD